MNDNSIKYDTLHYEPIVVLSCHFIFSLTACVIDSYRFKIPFVCSFLVKIFPRNQTNQLFLEDIIIY